MSDDVISRADWLRLEIDIDERKQRRLVRSPEIADRMKASSLTERLTALRSELAMLEGGAGRLRLRLAGGVIEGHNAPADLATLVQETVLRVADEFDAPLLVAPAGPGSHVIEFVTPAQNALAVDDAVPTFVEVFGALLDLADGGLGVDAPQAVRATVEEFTPDTLKAFRRLFKGLAERDVSLGVGVAAPNRYESRQISREWASLVTTILEDVDQRVEERTIEGDLVGFTQGSGRFEILVGDDVVKGRVPKGVRARGEGIRIGDRVRADVEYVVTKLPSRGQRAFYRMTDIRSITPSD